MIDTSAGPEAQKAPPSPAARAVSLAGLIVVLLVQAFVVLVAIVVAGVGGASSAQAAILFGGVGSAAALVLVLLVQRIRGAWKPIAAGWALAVPVIDVIAYAIVLGPMGGVSACDATDATVLRSVTTPPGVELQGQPGNIEGSCGQAFVASVPLTDVLSGYRKSLELGGWSILDEHTSPGSAEGGATAESAELSAQRGTSMFWVDVESGPGEPGGTYVGGSISVDTTERRST